jgi:hypothetical protein
MKTIRMIDFADRLSWELLNNQMNPDVAPTLVSGSTGSSSSNNVPFVTSVSGTSIVVLSVLSPASNGTTGQNQTEILPNDNGSIPPGTVMSFLGLYSFKT